MNEAFDDIVRDALFKDGPFAAYQIESFLERVYAQLGDGPLEDVLCSVREAQYDLAKDTNNG